MNIYIGKENLPKDAKFLFNVEQFFPQVLIADCEFNREVIRVIDGSEYVSTTMFKDRFGGGLRKSCLSTSCKILITLYQCPDIIVNCAEIGVNALDYVVKCLRFLISICTSRCLLIIVEKSWHVRVLRSTANRY